MNSPRDDRLPQKVQTGCLGTMNGPLKSRNMAFTPKRSFRGNYLSSYCRIHRNIVVNLIFKSLKFKKLIFDETAFSLKTPNLLEHNALPFPVCLGRLVTRFLLVPGDIYWSHLSYSLDVYINSTSPRYAAAAAPVADQLSRVSPSYLLLQFRGHWHRQ